jgi:putative nucleotidyltransferase with HDIG domain
MTGPGASMSEPPALAVVRKALTGHEAWLVGGAVRDRALGREVADFDVALDGEPRQAARSIAEAARAAGTRAASFPLSEEFGAWRVVAHDHTWQVDVERLRAPTLAEDLALRDFTVNAIAERLDGQGELEDPLGGLNDLRRGRLRLAGPGAFEDDPLRVLRLVRVAVELDLEPDSQAAGAAREQAQGLAQVSTERVFAELRRVIASERVLHGLGLMDELGITRVVLPELSALHGVEQSRFHHLDVHGHTLAVLEQTLVLQADPGSLLGESRATRLRAFMAEPLSDEMSRGDALRWGALLHDMAKPDTRAVRFGGRVTFMGHDRLGAEQARGLLGRLRTSTRLREHVAALVRHHLRLGFLVHERQPLARASVFDYLHACAPVEVDVTLLSVCDRLATRGAGSQEAIAKHLELAERMLEDALAWHEQGPPKPLLRGDQLAQRLGIAPGPRVGELLAGLVKAQYVGEIGTVEQALGFAGAQRHRPGKD